MTTKAKPRPAETITDLIKLTDKENPKPEDLRRLRESLNENAWLVEVNESSEQAFNRFIEDSTKSECGKELMRRQIKEKRTALNYESENAMVQMLINQVILNNIRLNQLEALHVGKLSGSHTSEHGYYWDKRLSSAQRRFLKACETLAKVKKILSEAELRDQQAKNKKSQSSLASTRLYNALKD